MFDKQILKDQCGIITGGTSGIGLEVARYLIKHGAHLTVTGRNEKKTAAAAEELGNSTLGVNGDVRQSDAIKANLAQHLEHFGKVDFLINNAAGNFLCPLEMMSENAFRSVNDIVTLGTFLWSRAVQPLMKKQGHGRIINTGTTYASGAGTLVGHSGAAKAAVLNLTKTMAVEWGPYGILCNMIAPGPVRGTEGVRRLMGNPQMEKMMQRVMPVKRMTEAWEIGALATFLLSSLAACINGAIIPVDGGLSLNNPSLLPAGVSPEELGLTHQDHKPAGTTAENNS